jgi:hypothetical protein
MFRLRSRANEQAAPKPTFKRSIQSSALAPIALVATVRGAVDPWMIDDDRAFAIEADLHEEWALHCWNWPRERLGMRTSVGWGCGRARGRPTYDDHRHDRIIYPSPGQVART